MSYSSIARDGDLAQLVGLNHKHIILTLKAGAEVQFVSEVRHSLEDVYLSLINHGNTR